MSAALELIQVVESLGGRFMVDGGRLGIVPATAAAELIDQLRQHKSEIIGLLESAPIPAATQPELLQDHPAEWREPFARWIASDCIAHWRLNGGVGRLHVAFSEWEAGHDEVPCTRAVFERLLREQSWKIHPALALVHGLMLRKDVDGDESVQDLPSGLQSIAFND